MLKDQIVSKENVKELSHVVVRFAGDSGDGMQVTGGQFTSTSALYGNDLATFPDFPAEIRAPAGTLAGVSGFQVHIGSINIHTPGDDPDVLVAMNPAALKANIGDFAPGTLIIIDTASFDERDLQKAGYERNPLDDASLDGFQLIKINITDLTLKALVDVDMDHKQKVRCKNFCALGIIYYIFNRDIEATRRWIQSKFSSKPEVAKANLKSLDAGYNFADTLELSVSSYQVKPAPIHPGTYRLISGNSAVAWGFMAAAKLSGLPLFLGSYPITPASDILHELSKFKNHGIMTFQAEDEIAAICSALGAAYGGGLAITTTSGPGMALKAEAMGLAVMAELPLVIIDVQRAGPSTGMPTKTEQADLLLAMYGRPSESPVIVVAPATPADCFLMAIEAGRLAVEHMTPVIFLSDGYLANGAEPWKIPSLKDLPHIKPPFAEGTGEYQPYARNPETLARAWAIPGMPGKEHRIGGLEKQDLSGNVSYDSQNHSFMVRIRAEKVARVADDIPLQKVEGAQEGDLLVISWGGTYGAVYSAVERLHAEGKRVGLAHLRYLNPFPKNLGDIIKRFKHVLVPELNLGQLQVLIRAKYGVKTHNFNKVEGQPFKIRELMAEINRVLKEA